jgi:hypothetical protein
VDSSLKEKKMSDNPYSYENLVKFGSISVLPVKNAQDLVDPKGKVSFSKFVNEIKRRAQEFRVGEKDGNPVVQNKYNKYAFVICRRHIIDYNKLPLTDLYAKLNLGFFLTNALPVNEMIKNDVRYLVYSSAIVCEQYMYPVIITVKLAKVHKITLRVMERVLNQ